MENSSGWVLLGTLVRRRREHLGLKQGDLAQYGGPAVSTVGKIERGEQQGYPLRTQHQVENALGWDRGTVRSIVDAPTSDWWEDEGLREDFIANLVEEKIPDLSRPTVNVGAVRRAAELSDDELLAELTYRMKRYAADREGVPDGERDAAPTMRAGVSPASSERIDVAYQSGPYVLAARPGQAAAGPDQTTGEESQVRHHGPDLIVRSSTGETVVIELKSLAGRRLPNLVQLSPLEDALFQRLRSAQRSHDDLGADLDELERYANSQELETP